MRHEIRLAVHVQKLDDIVVADNTATTGLRQRFSGDDLPLVVAVVVPVGGNLLALATDTTVIVLQRVTFWVRVQEDPGVLVPDRDRVVVADLCSRGIRTARTVEEHC